MTEIMMIRIDLAKKHFQLCAVGPRAAVLILGLRLIPLAPARPYVDVFSRWLRRTKQKISLLNQYFTLNVSLDSENKIFHHRSQGDEP